MKNYDKHFFFKYCLFFISLLPIGALAQNCEKPWKLSPVCGRIIDYDTGLPIAGAQIIGDPTCPTSTTNSNAQGVYCLNLNCCSICQNFPPIRYNNFVTVKASGYCLTRTRPIFGHIDSVNFYLSRNCNCSRTNDSLALVQMSNALNLNWPITTPLSNSNAWGGGSPGMFFSDNLCVAGINMKPGYGVIANGVLPTAFSTLTGLEEFDSEGDGTRFLSGTLPDMSNFRNLNYFRLRKSKMTGGVPATFGKLKNLSTFVVIQNTDLRGTIPPELGNMRELGVFLLYENNLTGTIPTELGNLKKLYEFDIHTNNLSGTVPTGFGTCDSLRHFFVDNCGLTGRDGQIDFLFRLPKLQYLGLSGNKFTGTIPKVPATPVNFNLSFINLNENQFDSLPPLSSQRFFLSVKNNKLTFDDLLPNMTYLNSTGQNCVTDYQYSIGGYAPQDSIGTEKMIIATVGSTITIDELKIDGAITDNSYQWYKNGVAYGAPLRNNKLIIPNFPASDTGTYVCQVTNPRAPLLTLNSRKIIIKILPCTAITPSVGTVTQPSCASPTGSVVLSGLPSTGTWTLTRTPSGVATTGTGTTTTVSGLSAGTYTFTVNSSAGCSSLATANVVINAAPPVPSTPSVGTITPPTCTVSTGGVVLNGLPSTGTWTLTRNPDGVRTTGTGMSTTISGLNSGTYTYSVTNTTGCASSPTPIIVINTAPTVPNPPTLGFIAQPICTIPNGSIPLTGLPTAGTWTVTRSPDGVTKTGTGDNTLITGIPPGTYTYTVTSASGCTSLATPNFVINPSPSTPTAPSVGTVTQPTCTVATGNVTLNGLPNTGTWTLTRSPDNVTTSGTGVSTTISGLRAGTYTFSVANTSSCASSATTSVVINAGGGTGIPTTPSVGTLTQPTCTIGTGSVVLNGLPNTGTWTLTRQDGVTTTGTGTSTTIAGLAAGTYTFTVQLTSGCASLPTANVVINPSVGNPSAPTINAIAHPTCTVSTGIIILNGLPSTGTWTLIRNDGVTTTGTGTSTTITGFAAGTYTYTVKNAAGCTSAPTRDIVINPNAGNPSTPSVGTISQPTCTISTGSVVLNGLPSTGTWTLTRNPDGVTTTGTGTSTTITGLAAGTYTFTVMNSTNCTSPSPTTSITINKDGGGIPSAPSVGTLTQPTCTVSTGTIVLNGLPSTGTWTLKRSPDGVTTTGTGTSTTITGLAAGTYTYSVTSVAGCVSSPTANITVTANAGNPSTPSVGTLTQPTCTSATGGVVLNGLPSTGTWTLTRRPDGVTTTGTGASTTISGLGVGTYTYTITNTAGCTSSPTGNIVINPNTSTQSTPSVGALTQPTCTVSTGSVVLNDLPNTGTWTLTRNPDGVTTTGTGSTTTITGLAAGIYTYVVTNSSGCTSLPTANISFTASVGNPNAPSVGTTTQPTCTVATGSVTLNGLPSTGIWALTRNDGATLTGTGASTTITGLSAGTYTYYVSSGTGCASLPTANIVINPNSGNPSTPSVNTLIQPTCMVSTGSIVLTDLPNTGTWILTRNPDGVTTRGTGATTTIAGVPVGTYTYTITTAAGCTSLPTGNIVLNPNTSTQTTPSVGALTQPTCTVSTGSVVLNDLPNTGTWILTRSPDGVTATGTGISTTITGLAAGIYTFTLTNSEGCAAAPTANIVINPVTNNLSAPSVGTLTQPSCSVATGSVVLNGLPNTGTWTLTRNDGTTLTGTGESTTITGLSAGTYAYIVTNSAGCESSATANISINASTGNPTTPSVGTLTQPTCTVATGSVVLNGLPSTGTWTLTRSPDSVRTTGTGSSTTIIGLVAGNYTFIVTNSTGCASSPTANITISASAGNPSTPSVGVLTQPTCSVATGSVFLSNLPNTGTWILTRSPDGVTTTGTGISTTIIGLSAGTYTYIVTNALGCASLPSTNVVVRAAVKPEAPLIGTIIQPTCTMPITTVSINGLPATGAWTLTRNPGAIISTGTGTGTNISGLPAGTYTFTVTNAATCLSSSSANVVINAPPALPSAPLVGTITNPPCDSATGSVVLSGLPDKGTWTLNPTGEKGTGTSTTVKKLKEGNYTFSVTNSDGCISTPSIVVITCKKDTVEKCLNDLVNQIPNGFTPGGNGVNDYFDPEKYLALGGCSSNVKAEELYIINRWGEMIFKASPYTKWDGRSSNHASIAPTSAYYYVLILKVGENRNSVKGVINLFAD
jgi:gliding motility-associated-like protein